MPVMNFCYEYQSIMFAMNTCHQYQILNQKGKNSGREKVGLRETKKTERKRSEGEVVVGEAVRAELIFPLDTKAA